MKKILILLVVACLLSVFVSASCVNSESSLSGIVNFCSNPDDGVCDDGEFPIVNSDCKVSYSNFVGESWFLKILVLAFIFYFASNYKRLDSKIMIIILIIVLAVLLVSNGLIPKFNTVAASTSTLPMVITTTTSASSQFQVIEVESSSVVKFWDDILNLGDKIYPGHGGVGWLVIGAFLIILIPTINIVMDGVEGILRKLF